MPVLDEVPSTTVDLFLDQLVHRSSPYFTDQVALSERVADGWADTTYGDLARGVRQHADALRAAGVGRRDHVGLLAEPSVGWVVAFLGALSAGAVVVPIDPKLTLAEASAIVRHAQPVVVAHSATLADQAAALVEDVDPAPTLVALAPPGTPPAASAPMESAPSGWRVDEPAVLAYTSGTTGAPKGVMLSLGNLMSQVEALGRAHPVGRDDVFLSILPLHHTFELTCGLLTVLHRGGRIAYSGSLLPADVLQSARQQEATSMVVVPLFLKVVRRRIEAELHHSPAAARRAMAIAWWLAARVPHRRLRRLLSRPVLRVLGPGLRRFYVGGAPLEPDVAAFFDRMGLEVYEGYGLTEASPVVTMNAPGANRLGTVGRPLDGVEVRIDALASLPDGRGEVLVRGPGVMLGYHRDPEATSEVLRDGWLRTGDVGWMDEAGHLHIDGRVKSLIVLASGLNVQPEEVEVAIETSPWVAEACVFGAVGGRGLTEGTEEVHAAVVPAEQLTALGLDPTELDRRLRDEVRRAVADLAPHKHPTVVIRHDDELPKTVTRKVRRQVVARLVAPSTREDR